MIFSLVHFWSSFLNRIFSFLGVKTARTSCAMFCKNKGLLYGLLSNLLYPHLDCNKIHESNLRFELLVVSTFLVIFLFLRVVNLFVFINLSEWYGIFMTALCLFLGGIPAAITIGVSYCIVTDQYLSGFSIFFVMILIRLVARFGVLSDVYQRLVDFMMTLQGTV